MNAQEYTDLLLNYDPKSEDQRKAFEKLTYRYPYFQSAYAHYLKSLKVQEQYNYHLILKKQLFFLLKETGCTIGLKTIKK